MAPSEKSPPPVTKEKKPFKRFFWLPTYLYFPHVKGWKKSLSFLVVERWEGPAGGRHQSLWQTEGSVVSGFFLPQPFSLPSEDGDDGSEKVIPLLSFLSFPPPFPWTHRGLTNWLRTRSRGRRGMKEGNFIMLNLRKIRFLIFHFLQVWYLLKNCGCILYIHVLSKNQWESNFFSA